MCGIIQVRPKTCLAAVIVDEGLQSLEICLTPTIFEQTDLDFIIPQERKYYRSCDTTGVVIPEEL